MKKIILLLLTVGLLVSCGSKNTKTTIDVEQVKTKLDETKELVNVKEKLKNIETNLKSNGLSGEKLKNTLKSQEKSYKILANLKGNARKKYVFENDILPKLIENEELTPKFCKTKNIKLYLKCLNQKNVSIDKLLKYIPESMKPFIKKRYFYQRYESNKKYLLEKTNDNTAISAKKEVLEQMYDNGSLRKKSVCGKLPEPEVIKYCNQLFE